MRYRGRKSDCSLLAVVSTLSQLWLNKPRMISTTRMSQIMWLDNLTSDSQEAVLDLPTTVNGRDVILERDVRPIAKTLDWAEQRKMWRALKRRIASQGKVAT